MPQASNEQRALMSKWFGGMDDWPVSLFLESHGYTLTKQWMWQKPTPSHTVTDAEWECLNFLCDEWDYGYDFSKLSNKTPLAQPFWFETRPSGEVVKVFRSYRDYCNG